MRLDKYLADMNLGTRSEVKKAIRAKAVTVNGETVRDPAAQITGDDAVCYHGKPVIYESRVYYMLHKPAGIISASADTREKTVVDLITENTRKDLFPAGRLDRGTEGLLLITNDGALAHRLLSPKHHVEKEYIAVVTGTVTEDDIHAFQGGIILEDGTRCRPAQLKVLPQTGDGSLSSFFGAAAKYDSLSLLSKVSITITEGKFHQIRRMFQARGREVLYLKRISMGALRLDPDLPPGAYRRLTAEELSLLKKLHSDSAVPPQNPAD